jgi:tRNA threonylcarbamoyladenosine biosynthesis protein TsaB
MSLILCIESGTNTCSVALGRSGELIDLVESHSEEHNHAKNLTVYIETLLKRGGLTAKNLCAVAVSKGPGSYTGLRIGVSAAKGMCYALNIPLIALGSLKVMANGVIDEYAKIDNSQPTDYFCPMIDARRMEVYTQLFNSKCESISRIEAKIIDRDSFLEILETKKILFFGNGSIKTKGVINHKNAFFFDDFKPSARFMIPLSWKKFLERQFEDVAYFEPLYLKDFVAVLPKNKVI